MIVSFKDSDSEKIFQGKRSKRLPPSLHRVAMRKLWMIDAATAVIDLRIPPGNRLEKLSGTYAKYHSIRVNNQWRIIFHWQDGNARAVQIIDYH